MTTAKEMRINAEKYKKKRLDSFSQALIIFFTYSLFITISVSKI